MTDANKSLLISTKSKARQGRGPKDGPKREAVEVEYQVINPDAPMPDDVLGAITNIAEEDAAVVWRSFRRGFNLYAYDAACDPLASLYDDSWTDGQRKGFRQLANALAAQSNISTQDAAKKLIELKLTPQEAEEEE